MAKAKASDYSRASLRALPTIRSSQTADLKIEEPTVLVWLSRLTKDDGVSQDHAIHVQNYNPDTGRWV